MRRGILHLVLSACVFSAAPAFAYYSVLDTGEILPEGTYKLTPAAQILTETGGANLSGRFDAGFQDEYGMRGLFGFGKTDFFLGGLFKWMPVPDIEGQPAIGFNAGVLYAKDGDVRDMTIRFEPLISKKFIIDQAALTPYASLPIGIRNRTSENVEIEEGTDVAFQLVVGTQLQVERWKKMQFIAELGVDLDNAPSHVSAGAVFYFDEEGF